MNAAGGMNPSTATAPQLDLCQNIVHLLNARDSLERDAGVEQTLEINFVRVLRAEKNVLAHDEPPDRVIDRRVIVVTLIDCELEQMFGTSRDRGIVIADTAFRFHSRVSSLTTIRYDSLADVGKNRLRSTVRAGVIGEDDAGAERPRAANYRPEGGPSPLPTR